MAEAGGTVRGRNHMDPETETKLKDADAADLEAEGLHMAACVLRIQAHGERLGVLWPQFEATVEEARAIAAEIAGCDLDGWYPATIHAYMRLYLKKEGLYDASQDTEEAGRGANWWDGTPLVLQRGKRGASERTTAAGYGSASGRPNGGASPHHRRFTGRMGR